MGYYALDELDNDEMRTEIIFAFLLKIFKLSKVLKDNQFVFCWDSRQSYRKLIYPEYKANRKAIDDEEKAKREIAFKQFTILRKEVLPNMGFKNVLRITGFEADDLMAWVAFFNKNKCTIVTTDHDLYQVLKWGQIYDPKKKEIITKEDFGDKYQIKAKDWYRVKAIGGCVSDNVKGIKGVGEVRAIKYIKGELKGQFLDRIESKEGKKLILRNVDLVMLPFPRKKLPLMPIQEDELTSSKFIDVFDKYDFQSFLKPDMWDRWKNLFGLVK